MRNFSGLAALIALVLVATATVIFGWAPGVATFKLETSDVIVETLMGLLVAALFMERAQEVFITAWRQKDREALESELENVKSKATGIESAKSEAQLTKEVSEYRGETRLIAFGLGLFIGLLFALSGIRTLSQIVNHENVVGLQESLFFTFDIVLTAGVIAGGSEGLHKLISVFTDAFDATRARLKP